MLCPACGSGTQELVNDICHACRGRVSHARAVFGQLESFSDRYVAEALWFSMCGDEDFLTYLNSIRHEKEKG